VLGSRAAQAQRKNVIKRADAVAVVCDEKIKLIEKY